MIILQLLVFSFGLVRGKNVLFLFADDAGLEIGALGNPVIQTPNLDSLASRSTVFTQAYTSVSSCSPSRSAVLTGLPVHQNGMFGLHHDVHHFNSFEGVRSVSKILGDNNVTTGIIGKKHVGPEHVYPFDFAQTEENNHINQVGRNITHMAELVREFLDFASEEGRPFFLYVAFHDPHRCGHTQPSLGLFCEKYGNGEPGMGLIPDWEPRYYRPEEVVVPGYVPDTPASRIDIAKQYTSISRMDQGVGLVIKEFNTRNLLNDTLVLFSSDNGIPFPLGKTNLYTGGVHQPFFISEPTNKKQKHQKVDMQVSLLDVTPTILDWMDIAYPSHSVLKHHAPVQLTGRSLLPLLEGYQGHKSRDIFGSHIMHEATMYYPMRSIRTGRFTLIHNINYWAPFPIDQDGYLAPSFQDILQRTQNNQTLDWIISLSSYYYRPEWELYDRKSDRLEVINVANKPRYQPQLLDLQKRLFSWSVLTDDPWMCSPHSVLESSGTYKKHPQCMNLYN